MTYHFWIFQHTFWIFHFILVFVFLAHLLRQRRAPASTLAWFLIALVAPYIGIPLYLTFGLRKFLPPKPFLFGQSPSQTQVLVDPIQRTLRAVGSPPPSKNMEFNLLDSGEQAFAEMKRAIDEARSSIFLETYIFSDDDVGTKLLELLTKKVKAGVDVRILIDSVGARLPGHPSFNEFKAAGGQVAFFMPLLHRPFRGTSNLRNHRKQMIIDHTFSFLGGMNVAQEYMGPTVNPDRWVDTVFSVCGPIVEQLETVFLADWSYATKKTERRVQSETVDRESSGHVLQLVVSGPDVATDPIYEVLLTAIYGARERIWIATPYFIPDEALAKAIELACRRGVDVRLLLPRKSNHYLADIGRTTYLQQVQKSGARIFLFPKMMHAKATLVDMNYAIVGSANFDGRSLFLNYELGLCVYSQSDNTVIEKWFEGLFHASTEDFVKLNCMQDVIGDLARLVGPLI
jgi:cardiolipin synthase A/B